MNAMYRAVALCCCFTAFVFACAGPADAPPYVASGAASGTTSGTTASTTLTDDSASDAVIRACQGQYENRGQCVKCVTYTLNALRHSGQLTGGDAARLTATFAQRCNGGCLPTTCSVQGDDCGAISDLCGGTLDCGTCTSPETCGGGGTSDVCGLSSGCAHGVSAGLTQYPGVALCPGAWSGGPEGAEAEALCAPGWKVCDSTSLAIKSVQYGDAIQVPGCYAYNAAQDNDSCIAFGNVDANDDMAGIGGGCTSGYYALGAYSCIQGGRLDASCCITTGAYWSSGNGIVCCAY